MTNYKSQKGEPEIPVTLLAAMSWRQLFFLFLILGALIFSPNHNVWAVPATWVNIGAEGGPIADIVIDPTNTSKLYAATKNGAVFKTVDGGLTWQKTSLIAGRIDDLILDTSNPSTIFAAAFPHLYKSTNSGTTWQISDSGMETSPYSIAEALVLAMNPVNPSILYAGTANHGVYESTDGGANWNSINVGIPGTAFVNSLIVDPANPSVLYAGVLQGGNAVYKSTDGGGSWSPVAALTGLKTKKLLIDSQTPSTLYAIFSDFSGKATLYKTVDSGTTWSTMGVEASALAIDPANALILYRGTLNQGLLAPGGLFKSTDGGTTWAPSDSGITYYPGISLITINPNSPNVVYAGTPGGGVYKSTDSGGIWIVSNSGLIAADVRALAVDPVMPTTLYAGTGGNGLVKSTDGGATWRKPLYSGPTTSSIVSITFDPTTPSTLYSGSATITGVFTSADSGETWSRLSSGISGSVRDIVIDPASPATLYAATYFGVKKSVDSGTTWTMSTTGLFNTNVKTLAIDASAVPPTLYAGTAQSVFKSNDGGLNWSASRTGIFTGGFWPQSNNLVIDATTTPHTLYTGTSVGLAKSTDGGNTWVYQNLPLLDWSNSDILSLLIDPVTPSVIYAGTREGVFKSTDGGSHWASIGLNNLTANALALDSANHIIYAGTSNSGIFKFSSTLSPPVPTIMPSAPVINEDSTAQIQIYPNDPNAGDTHTFSTSARSGFGSVSVDALGLVTYTPDVNLFGTDYISILVTDNSGLSATIPFAITVIPVNDAPVPTAPTITTNEDTSATSQVTHNDPDVGDTHTYAVTTVSVHGTASVDAAGLATYTPNPNFNGVDNFTVRVTDAAGATGTVTINVAVNPVNDAPTATSAAIATNEDTPSAGVTPNVTDVDIATNGDTHTFTIVTQPAHGAASIVANKLVYMPSLNFNGADSFTFRTTDTGGLSVDGTATVTVNPINDAPSPTAPPIVTNEDTPAVNQVAHNDPDVGDTHTYNVTTTPANGTASVNATGISLFVPNANFNGTDFFVVAVTDAAGATGNVTINVTVNPVNDAPAPTAPSITTSKATPGTSQVTHNDPDVGDTHTFGVTTAAANGAASVNPAGLATYTPNPGFVGNDSFAVTVTDAAGATGAVTINVTVNAPVVSTVGLSLNGTAFRTGSAMTLTVATVASIPGTNADVYVALQLPDGTLLVMQPDGSFSTAVTPLLSNFPVPDFTGPIFNYTFIGTEPVGTYIWYAMLAQPGTLNIIGSLAVAPFNFVP